MSDFNCAVDFVLENEGGFSANPHDPGGATNYGISLRFLSKMSVKWLDVYGLKGKVNEETVRNLTKEQAILIYRIEFWNKAIFRRIKNQRIVNYVFDCCVHHGIREGIKILQGALNVIADLPEKIEKDGILGYNTVNATNASADLLIRFLPVARGCYYWSLVKREPKYMEFLHGWFTRCNHI